MEAQSVCKDIWRDQNLPSMTGAILRKNHKYNVRPWVPPSGMCKDVRLLKDPIVPVVWENVADPGPSDNPETASAVRVESLAWCPVEMTGHSTVSPSVPRSLPAETVCKAPDVEMVPTDSGTSAGVTPVNKVLIAWPGIPAAPRTANTGNSPETVDPTKEERTEKGPRPEVT